MMHNAVKKCAASHNIRVSGKSTNNGGFNFLFSPVKPLLEKYDIVLGNLEFPISPPYTSQEIIFNCPPDILGALKDSGFTLLTLANNHILDQGIKGVFDTMNHVRSSGIDYIGVRKTTRGCSEITVIEQKGMRLGILAFTGIINYPIPENRGFRINWLYNKKRVITMVRRAARQSDFLIMVIHTGMEYKIIPEKYDKKLFREICEAGADLIIGHHPHVLQPVEMYETGDKRKCPIFYSLGNFISNQTMEIRLPHKKQNISTAHSAIVEVTLRKRVVSRKISASYRVIPMVTTKNYNRKTGTFDIQTAPLDHAVKMLKKRKWRVRRAEKNEIAEKLENLKASKKAIKAVLFMNGKERSIKFD